MTVRNYTLGLIFVLADGEYRQHLQYVLSHHGQVPSPIYITVKQVTGVCNSKVPHGNISANFNNCVAVKTVKPPQFDVRLRIDLTSVSVSGNCVIFSPEDQEVLLSRVVSLAPSTGIWV